jgi:hypothetical protein
LFEKGTSTLSFSTIEQAQSFFNSLSSLVKEAPAGDSPPPPPSEPKIASKAKAAEQIPKSPQSPKPELPQLKKKTTVSALAVDVTATPTKTAADFSTSPKVAEAKKQPKVPVTPTKESLAAVIPEAY